MALHLLIIGRLTGGACCFQEEPIDAFAALLAVTLIVPPIFERFKLPGVLGLLAMGVALGPNSLGVLSAESPVVELLADVGLLAKASLFSQSYAVKIRPLLANR